MEPLEKQLADMAKMPTGETPIETSDAVSVPVATVSQAPVTPAVPEEQYESGHKGHLAPIRTFNSDLAQAIREKGGSVVRVAIAENERHQREAADRSIKSTKNMIFTIVGMILVIASMGAIVWSYLHHQSASTVVPDSTARPASLVSAEDDVIVNVGGMQIPEMVSSIQKIVANPGIQTGMIKDIVLTNGPTVRIPAQQFLKLLATHAPNGFTQALLPDFMLGTYMYDKSNLFMIVHGTAHDFLLAGMLDWEPFLFNDMTALFAIDTSSFTRAELQSVPFKDAVIANRDARAVLDASGNPLFFYSFLDQNTIIFATDPRTLTEVVHRY